MNDMSINPPDIEIISNPPTPAPSQNASYSEELYYNHFDSLDDINSEEWNVIEGGIKQLLPAVRNATPCEEDCYDNFDSLEDINSGEWRALEEDIKRLLPAPSLPLIAWNNEEKTKTRIPWIQNERANVCSQVIIDRFIIINFIQDEAVIRSMARLPFVTGNVTGITQVKNIHDLSKVLASNIEKFRVRVNPLEQLKRKSLGTCNFMA